MSDLSIFLVSIFVAIFATVSLAYSLFSWTKVNYLNNYFEIEGVVEKSKFKVRSSVKFQRNESSEILIKINHELYQLVRIPPNWASSSKSWSQNYPVGKKVKVYIDHKRKKYAYESKSYTIGQLFSLVITGVISIGLFLTSWKFSKKIQFSSHST